MKVAVPMSKMNGYWVVGNPKQIGFVPIAGRAAPGGNVRGFPHDVCIATKPASFTRSTKYASRPL